MWVNRGSESVRQRPARAARALAAGARRAVRRNAASNPRAPSSIPSGMSHIFTIALEGRLTAAIVPATGCAQMQRVVRTERCAALRATGRGRAGGAGAAGRAAGHGARRCEPEAALLCNDPRAPEAFVGALTLPRKRWSGRCRRPRAALSCPRCPPRRANCARSKTAPRPSPRAPAPPGAPCARARATSPRGKNQGAFR